VKLNGEFTQLLDHLHRGGQWAHLWRAEGKESLWWPAGKTPAIPMAWANCNVYFSVHPTSQIPTTNSRGEPTGQKYIRCQTDQIAAVNCLYAEFDGDSFGNLDLALDHIEGLHPPPSAVIFSGGGYHCYWLLAKPYIITSEEQRQHIRQLQRLWVDYVRSDGGAKDLARVLRVPGTKNVKPEYAPHFPTVAMETCDFNTQYTLEDLAKLLPGPEGIPAESDPGDRIEDLAHEIHCARRNLTRLRPERCEDYSGWLEVGMALHQLGSDGLDLWDRWSRNSEKYQPGACARKWASFKAAGGGLTLASLQKWADEDDPPVLATTTDVTTPPEPQPPPWEGEAGEPAEDAQRQASVLDWHIYTPQDAFEQREPLQYVVNRLFALPSLTIVYGAPSSLKSLLMLEACICVAAGLPWLGPLPNEEDPQAIKTVCCPTLYLDFDNGPRRMHERVAAIMKARELSPDAIPFAYASMPAPWLDASDPIHMDELVELLNRANAGLTVIDNLGLVSGRVDENSAEMVQVLSSFRQVTESTGGALSLIHHQRKTSGFKTRAGETLRGHSSIEAALDLALLVEREEGADTATIRSTKTRDVDVAPFGAMFTYEHKPGSSELATARFFGVTVTDDRKPARATRAIIQFLRSYEGKPNRTALVDGARELEDNLGRDYLRDTIDMMERRGDLLTEPGPHRSTLYGLPGRLL